MMFAEKELLTHWRARTVPSGLCAGHRVAVHVQNTYITTTGLGRSNKTEHEKCN